LRDVKPPDALFHGISASTPHSNAFTTIGREPDKSVQTLSTTLVR
jgi:hypothetical protein